MASILGNIQERLTATSLKIDASVPFNDYINQKGDDDKEYIFKENNIKQITSVEKMSSLKELIADIEKLMDENVKPGKKRKIEENQMKQKKNKDGLCIKPIYTNYVAYSCVKDALKKCIVNESFWSSDALKTLLERDIVPPEFYDLVCECILKYNALELLRSIHLEEERLLKCLKYVLREKFLSKIKLTESIEKDVLANDQNTFNIYMVLSLPFDDEKMRNYLKLLTTDEAILLFHILHRALFVVSPALKCPFEDNTGVVDLSEKQLMSWIDSVISAKLSTFLSSPSLQRIIIEFSSTLKKQVSFYQHISQLQPYLEQLQNSLRLPEKKIGRYAIETITL